MNKDSGSRWRLGMILLVASLWLGLAGWAHVDVSRSIVAERGERIERLAQRADFAEQLLAAERALLDAELEQLRVALRKDAIWSTAGAGAAPEGSRDRSSIAARRRDALLRRAMTDRQELLGLEIVVAGHDGLGLTRLGRGADDKIVLDDRPNEAQGLAKASWYAEEVQRAVAANGRAVERGEPGVEIPPGGGEERPLRRAVIGLHAPGELVQGALVATLDTTRAAERLAAIAGERTRLRLTDANGRVMSRDRVDEAEAARVAAWVATAFASEDPAGVIEAGGRLVYGRPIPPADGAPADLVVLLETDAPPIGRSAWLASDWPAALGAFSVVASLALFLLLRGGLGAARARRGAGSAHPDARSNPAGIVLAPERFALRGWLADVRSCLEREAARRGQALEMQCERSLPEAVETDPGWLGGLVVAMGREALDASGDERVRVAVSEDVDDALRIEVEAEGVALGPVCGMQAIASSIGARFESTSKGGMALVVSSLLA